jgi:hypothetical protein
MLEIGDCALSIRFSSISFSADPAAAGCARAKGRRARHNAIAIAFIKVK